MRAKDELILAKDAIIESQRSTISSHERTIMSLTMPAGGSTLTVRQVYERFEKAHKSRPNWIIKRNRLRAFLAVFGDDPAMTVTPPKWAEFRERRKASDVICGRPIAPLTINFELSWAKRLFNWANEAEQNLLPANPLARAKPEKVDDARETWLTEQDIQTLLRECGVVIAAFIPIAVDTGARISEVMTLRRDRMQEVELSDGRVFALGEISKRRTKNKKAHRLVLTPRCREAIALLPEIAGNPYLFPSPKKAGRPYGVRHIARLFRAACERSGIDVAVADGDGHVRCHDLRRTAATAATRRGASLLQVQRMLNHSSPAVTAKYVQVTEEDMVAIAAIMDAGAAKERRRGPRRIDAPSATVSKEIIANA